MEPHLVYLCKPQFLQHLHQARQVWMPPRDFVVLSIRAANVNHSRRFLRTFRQYARKHQLSPAKRGQCGEGFQRIQRMDQDIANKHQIEAFTNTGALQRNVVNRLVTPLYFRTQLFPTIPKRTFQQIPVEVAFRVGLALVHHVFDLAQRTLHVLTRKAVQIAQ